MMCFLINFALTITLSLVIIDGGEGKTNVLIMLGDDVGFETQIYNNSVSKTPHLNDLAKRSVLIRNAFTSVSSCSPSRAALLTGMPQHQNGMYGLHHVPNHFHSFDDVQSLPLILKDHDIKTGIIGKKHIGPDNVYKFDYEKTGENSNIMQVSRNVTFMKEKVREFLSLYGDNPFLLYIGFMDNHRCAPDVKALYGEFCEKYGNGVGVIPDWKPLTYDPADVIIPYYLPDTEATREELAKLYTIWSRLDAGVGMLLSELKSHGYLDETLIIFTSDNGTPFPVAKTNLYEPGMGEPMLISSPLHTERWGQISDALTFTIDIVPTILDWFNVGRKKWAPPLTGKSMLPLLTQEPRRGWDQVFASHDMHEVTMYYPMRVMRTHQYRLIHNLNNRAPYPIARDLFMSDTFQDILNRTRHGDVTNWYKDLKTYYYRPEYELYDIINDPHEMMNLADDGEYQKVLESMKRTLMDWRVTTQDPWKCYPHMALHDDGTCQPLYNDSPL